MSKLNDTDNVDIVEELGLSPNTTQHAYQNINHFIDVLSRETDLFTADKHTASRSQYFVFHEVTESVFNRDFIDPIDSLVTFESYFPHRGIMIVKIMTRGESHVASSFGLQLMKQLTRMREELDNNLFLLGTAHVISENRIKRADNKFRSRKLPRGRSKKWPSLCVEVGYSDLPRKLVGDAKWWISESGG